MKINSIDKRSENCYQVSVETDNGICFVFDFPYSPNNQEIEKMLNDAVQQTETIE